MKEKKVHYNSVDEEILSKGKEITKDFDDSKEFSVMPKPQENKLISIRLPMAMIRALRAIARMKGDIGYQQIIKTYIADGLSHDQQQIILSQYVLVSGSAIFSSASLTQDISSRDFKSESCMTNIS